MIRINKNIIRPLYALLLLAALFSACSGEDITDSSTQAVRTDSIYIKLEMTSPTNTTRANPTGGESGDGTEGGVNKENDIKEVALFFYQADAGINSTEDPTLTPITTSSVSMSKSDKLHTAKFSVPSSTLQFDTPYHLIVVANPTEDVSAITTLKGLKEAVLTKPWTSDADINNYDNFVMSSRFLSADATDDDIKGEKGYKDITYTLTRSNTQNNPLTIESNIERLAARIDIVPVTETNNAKWNDINNGYEFPVTGAPEDKLIVTNVMPVNCMTKGTFLMKRLAAANATNDNKIDYTTISWVGKEQPDNNVQTNYVVDPYTEDKNGADLSTYYSNVYSPSLSVTSDPIQQTTKPDDHYILAYTMENTMDKNCQLPKYATGIVVKGIYVPKKWYTVDGDKLKEEVVTTTGATFYTFSGHVFASTAAIRQYIQDTEGKTVDVTDSYAGVSTYTGGVCYYVYWLRHSNDNDPTVKGIMEYGVVRNNIYRLALNTFFGIGDPIPGSDTDVEKMNCNVYVVPWAVYTHSEIVM